MKKSILYLVFATATLFPTSCDLVNPTEVVNPNLTMDKVLTSDQPMINWIAGLERQLALVYNSVIVNLEIASDNYQNTQTYYNQNLDVVKLDFQDSEINTIQFTIADLRESAQFGLTRVKAADATTTPDQEAELYFYKGWAELLAGEIFVALPAASVGPAISASENTKLAIADFQKALELSTDATKKASYYLALARGYYALGDKTNAKANAESAIAVGNTFTRFVRYDGIAVPNTLNDMQLALFGRGNFDDLQPLPRLDFLDPKYSGPTANQASVCFQKIEEAHLILAEAALSDGLLPDAKNTMKTLLELVKSRTKKSLLDDKEGRDQSQPGERPDQSDLLVAASATSSFKSGLVLDRKDSVRAPSISGTSVTMQDIDLLSTVDAALETVYLLRQEIFIAEGRRMVDLGIRFPVSELEALSNSNITVENTKGFVPAFIPMDMDAFTYNKVAKTVVIKTNMNKVLVDNKTSPSILPFH